MGHNDFELKAARVKIGFSTILRSPVLLPLYLGYLSPLVSDSQHIPNALGFPYRKPELASLFWMGKTAVALAISHGRYWERLERRTLTSDLLLFQASLGELRDTPIPTPTIFLRH